MLFGEKNHSYIEKQWRYDYLIFNIRQFLSKLAAQPRQCISNIYICMYLVRPGRVAQSVTCLTTDAFPTANQGVASSIPARYHTFTEVDHEIISTVIHLPSADLFKKGCCQLQAKVSAQITG